ncbi:hypothetical protein VITU102760_15830 [Vibrio tubiashii]
MVLLLQCHQLGFRGLKLVFEGLNLFLLLGVCNALEVAIFVDHLLLSIVDNFFHRLSHVIRLLDWNDIDGWSLWLRRCNARCFTQTSLVRCHHVDRFLGGHTANLAERRNTDGTLRNQLVDILVFKRLRVELKNGVERLLNSNCVRRT